MIFLIFKPIAPSSLQEQHVHLGAWMRNGAPGLRLDVEWIQRGGLRIQPSNDVCRQFLYELVGRYREERLGGRYTLQRIFIRDYIIQCNALCIGQYEINNGIL